ncbi:MAG: 16S rRNA (guanine(527)-N(7))-methyltransferase RsmG [Eubacterium sp.]|nr:16S rRNA (guanine(527)-N(7))-methyltransferase RsmG [Eubacterium sp.]
MLEKYQLDSFRKDLDELHIILSEKQISQFMQYYELLIEWGRVINLTSIMAFDEVLKKHFIDSLSLVKVCSLEKKDHALSLLDIGSGAGFPALPLKIAFPDLNVTLLDALQKRVAFLNKVIETLQLDGIETIHGRAEEYAKPGQLREQYDLCVSRAVANLSTLSEYCLPYVKVGGQFIAYKSEKIEEEIEAAGYAIKLLGGKMADRVSFLLPNSDLYRSFLVVEKCTPTPMKYPRKIGKAIRKPLSAKKGMLFV